MKKNLIYIAVFFLLFSCKKKEFNVYKNIDMYSLRTKDKLKFYFFEKAFLYIRKNNDSIFIKVNGEKYNSELYTKTKNGNWYSFNIIKKQTKGKLIINPSVKHKFIYNDTILIFYNNNIRLKGVPYKCDFSYIQIETRNNGLKFYYPNFNSLKERLTKQEIDSLLKNCAILELKEKHNIDGILYEDIIETNLLNNKINKNTHQYKLNGYSEYYIKAKNNNIINKDVLKYKER